MSENVYSNESLRSFSDFTATLEPNEASTGKSIMARTFQERTSASFMGVPMTHFHGVQLIGTRWRWVDPTHNIHVGFDQEVDFDR